MPRREIWYFEASAIHFLRQSFSAVDARATRELQRERGRWIAFSPVTLWEILNTPVKSEREELLFFAQNFFEREILMTPEEAIAGYLTAGCPLHEPTRDLRSNIYREEWRAMVDDPNRTLSFDDYSRLKTEIIRKLAKVIYRTVRDEKISNITTDLTVDFQITSQSLLERIKHPVVTECADRGQLSIYRTASLLVFVMLCSEITPHALPYRLYWARKGITDPILRFMHLADHHPELVFRGPFVLMSLMARLQARRKFSRGLLFDCMHAIYLPYCDALFSEDRHFVELSHESDHPNFQKISLISSVQMTTSMRSVEMPPWGILAG